MNGVCLSPGGGSATAATTSSSSVAVRPGGSGGAHGGSSRRSRSQGTRKLHKCMSTASYSEGVFDAASPQIHGGLHPARHSTLLVTRQYQSFDKLDSSFSRSRSSSMSSLENISSEGIHCLAFADSFTRKSADASPCPALWVGTSLGSVLTVLIQISGSDSTRITQPVTVQPCGTIFRLKGCIRTIAFLDCAGALMAYQGEPWRDDEKTKTPTKCPNNSRMSPTLSGGGSQDSGGGAGSGGDRQYAVFASEKQARVVALPSHNCVYKQQLTDTDFIIRAEIITLKDGVVLACYVSSGYVSVYSLPSLRPLTHTEFLPLSDLSFQTTNKGIVDPMLSIWGQQMFVIEDTDQIGKTFCFSNRGHGLYLCSPTEVQKFTLSSDFCSSYSEMAGELFLPHDMPEPPKLSFFSGLFGGGARSLDREELFGEASGRASRTVAKHIPGPSSKLEELGAQATTASNEVSRARMMMIERGEKLGQLEETSAKLMNEAEDFASTAHNLKLKYKDKKWYQL